MSDENLPEPDAARNADSSASGTDRCLAAIHQAGDDALQAINRISPSVAAEAVGVKAWASAPAIRAADQALSVTIFAAARRLSDFANERARWHEATEQHRREHGHATEFFGRGLNRYDREAALDMILTGVGFLLVENPDPEDLEFLRHFARKMHGGHSTGNDAETSDAACCRNVASVLDRYLRWLSPWCEQGHDAKLVAGDIMSQLADCGVKPLPAPTELEDWVARYTPNKAGRGKLSRDGLIANIVYGSADSPEEQRKNVTMVKMSLNRFSAQHTVAEELEQAVFDARNRSRAE